MEFQVVKLGSVGSTQDELRQRVRAGLDVTGLCLRAEAQTSGRGRRGSEWTSGAGGSYQSVGIGRAHRSWLTLALGIGIASALGRLPGRPAVAVKWPNDLFLDGGKLGGILTEVVSHQVLVGVGVNVDNTVPPGSSRLEGQELAVVSNTVLAGISEGLDLALAGGEDVAAAFSDVDMLRARHVEVVMQSDSGSLESVVHGVGVGIDATGALLLRDSTSGEVRRAPTGHVTRYGRAYPGDYN